MAKRTVIEMPKKHKTAKLGVIGAIKSRVARAKMERSERYKYKHGGYTKQEIREGKYINDMQKRSDDMSEVLKRLDALERENAALREEQKKQEAEAEKLREQAKAAQEIAGLDKAKVKEEVEATVRKIDWNNADPEDFWGYEDSAHAWTENHIDGTELQKLKAVGLEVKDLFQVELF